MYTLFLLSLRCPPMFAADWRELDSFALFRLTEFFNRPTTR